MARKDWQFGVLPPTDDDGNYLQVIGGIGPWEISEDGKTVTNLITGTVYDFTAIGSGGSTDDTRTDISDDGTAKVSDTEDINFGSVLSVTDDGDGSVTVAGQDTHLDIADSTGVIVGDATQGTFVASGDAAVDVTNPASGEAQVAYSVSLPSVSDGGAVVIDPFSDLNFGSFLSVTDDGDGTVTVDGSNSEIRTRQATIPLTEIADTNTAVGLQLLVPDGKTLTLLEAGVTDDAENAPAGLTIEVQDLTNATSVYSANSKHNDGSPLATVDGPVDVQFRVANSTGGAVNASGYVLFTME